ncbi:MAG: hypothetical protein K2P85_01805 [Flavobacteriaceae bacterium]|nr:hypothetical protein [Flavobacteriaceae bacterium]
MSEFSVNQTIWIDFKDIDFDEILDFIKSKGYTVVKPNGLTEAYKYEHFKSVVEDYTLQEIENLLPTK